jgi:hypothetical protein
LFEDRLATLPDPIRADVRRALIQPADQRSSVDNYLADKFGPQLQPDDKLLDKLLPEMFPDYGPAVEQRNSAIAVQERQRIAFDDLRALYDQPGPVETPLLRRGIR